MQERKRGGGSGNQKFVYQKWPDQNFAFSHYGHFGLGGGGPGGLMPALTAVVIAICRGITQCLSSVLQAIPNRVRPPLLPRPSSHRLPAHVHCAGQLHGGALGPALVMALVTGTCAATLDKPMPHKSLVWHRLRFVRHRVLVVRSRDGRTLCGILHSGRRHICLYGGALQGVGDRKAHVGVQVRLACRDAWALGGGGCTSRAGLLSRACPPGGGGDSLRAGCMARDCNPPPPLSKQR